MDQPEDKPDVPKGDGPKDFSDRVTLGAEGSHEAFQRHIQALLDDANLSEEDRQRILTNSHCPCCGAAASLTVKLGD